MGRHDLSPRLTFQTHPDRYQHIKLEIDGPVAWIKLNVQENKGLSDQYQLKLNSYDMSVDMELADAVNRLRFESPEVACVIITSAIEGIFSSGANIFMLGMSSHNFKVNFCKFTNETRLYIEDATENSGQTYIAALNGIASGGGYELPLACKEIYLVDDRRSAVALPEVPYLGVLPGTGGLTRVVDKRKVRRDLADIFVTLAEGIKGKRAKEWGLVDGVFPTSTFYEQVKQRAKEIALNGHLDRKGIKLEPVEVNETEKGLEYKYVSLTFGPYEHTAKLLIKGPDVVPAIPQKPEELGSSWYPLEMFRELDDCLLRLRFNHPETGLIIISTSGSTENVLSIDKQLSDNKNNWFVKEVILLIKRTLKRLDVTSKSFFTVVDKGSCFVGSLLEIAFAGDRIYMLDDESVKVALTDMNLGLLPSASGLSRLQARFLNNPEHANNISQKRELISAQDANEYGIVTYIADGIDWEDDIRLAVEERASFSPDALTGMEANLRFAGPETLETKIFGRLSAWQNWIFQRPNAVGDKGALSLYGRPETPEFDWKRT
ncbi:MAG: benzoyl-CoA-dihydrodiol lyase [Planctomycetes bacterium]|nr:benzoyl-CoA-dihydrodiol lyase [Planctomycetota bacterium]